MWEHQVNLHHTSLHECVSYTSLFHYEKLSTNTAKYADQGPCLLILYLVQGIVNHTDEHRPMRRTVFRVHVLHLVASLDKHIPDLSRPAFRVCGRSNSRATIRCIARLPRP